MSRACNQVHIVGNSFVSRLGGFFFFCLSFAFCASSVVGSEVEEAQAADSIIKILKTQEAAWNSGDIKAFMQAYWKSEKLTFSSGGNVERGWQATHDRYMKRYPDRQTMGKLSFDSLEVELLSGDVALMLGRWKLDRQEPISGNFSLVWKKIDGQWVIVHDHTSADPKKE